MQFQKRQKNKNTTSGLTNIEVYILVASNRIKTFPNNFWTKESSKELTKYLIEVILEWSPEDVRKKLCVAIFKEHHLLGALKQFRTCVYDTLNNAYPGKYMPWDLTSAPNKFWTKTKCKQAMYWLIKTDLKWNRTQVCENICTEIIVSKGLRSILKYFTIYELLTKTFPKEKYLPWELKKSPQGTWNEENTILAVKWMIEVKLKWKKEDVCRDLTSKTFEEYGLNGMFSISCKHSIIRGLDLAYPGEYRTWELRKVKVGFWNKETAKEALIWLVEERFHWSFDDVVKNICYTSFTTYKIKSLLKVFENNIKKALINAYGSIYDNVFLLNTKLQ